MEFQDKVLKCIDCGADFVFTAGEQLFFHDKQFKNEPKRCKACKAKRAATLGTTSPAVVPRWKPGPTVPAAARRPPSPSSPRKAGRSFAGSASSSGALPLPLPDLSHSSDSIAPTLIPWTRGILRVGNRLRPVDCIG